MKDKLHRYSGDTSDRRYIHVYITIISILFAYLLFWISENTCIFIPWWLDAPAILGFYGIVYFAFKKVLWKIRFLRTILSIKTPNWNGEYLCKLTTSYDNFNSLKDYKVKIVQDWDMILIYSETEHSTSNSLSGSFSMNDSLNPQFTFEYYNKPKNDAPDSMQIHYGMATIWFDLNKIKGEFFNGRGRNNYGTFNEL